jgi:hypothetical protein
MRAAHFHGLELLTAPGEVMTPRPTTEALVDRALELVGNARVRVADVGTGSGAIAVALAARAPRAEIWATDTSPAAVALARANAERHGVADRVEFPGPVYGAAKNELLARATDHDPVSAWSTERYDSWGWKDGVGLIVDAGRPVRISRLTVVSDTPGFRAEVRAGASETGPFERVSASRTVTGSTVFCLAERSSSRYLLLWITQLGPDPSAGGAVHVNEVRALRPA